MKAFVCAFALLVLAAGCASGSGPSTERSQRHVTVRDKVPEASVQAMRTALGAWSAYPIDAAPRPLVLIDGRVSGPASGFATNDAKEAFLSGAFVAPNTLPSGPETAAGYPVVSAADALEAMRSEGTPGDAPGPPAPLVITAARFDSARFSTDRGTQVLPAWLFTLRGVADPAAVLAVAPSDQFSAPAASLHRSSVSAQLDADGRTATISFTGAKPGTGPCTASYTVDQLASSTAVAINVLATRDDTTNTPCAQVGYTRRAVIRLTSPLGARVLVDANTTGPVATAP